MKDAITEAMADRVGELVASLERVGLQGASIVLGLEIAANRLRERIEQDHVAGNDNPADTASMIGAASLAASG
jgi:hypothetical protein